jgi:hypothetical protein
MKLFINGVLCPSKRKAAAAAEIAFDNILGGCKFDELRLSYDFNYTNRSSTVVRLHSVFVTELGSVTSNLIANAIEL